jgi:hypothetical protein
MAEARRRHDWLVASHIMALVANCNRDPQRRRRPFDIVDFLPPDLRRHVRRSDGAPLTREALHALRPLFEKERR